MTGGKQLGFTHYELTTAKKQTKREKFLFEMESVVPWQALITLIKPHYPKASKKGGHPPCPLATMLRILLLQQWYFGMKVHTGVDKVSGLPFRNLRVQSARESRGTATPGKVVIPRMP